VAQDKPAREAVGPRFRRTQRSRNASSVEECFKPRMSLEVARLLGRCGPSKAWFGGSRVRRRTTSRTRRSRSRSDSQT
jgi:hypothetical protein